MNPAPFIAIVGANHVMAADAVEARYLTDETGGKIGLPALMVRPADTQQVSAVLALCHQMHQPVVVQGGRTGMARGALPQDGEVILSLERLSAIEVLDATAGTLIAQAGVALATVQAAAADAGWWFGVDLGARGSCTIGGMIATNAGGHQVVRHGLMRDQILGLEAVLADGTVISSMRGLMKDNAGYDLKHLFIGSEGTLGVVTRAMLRLRPSARSRQTAYCTVPRYGAALLLLSELQRRSGAAISAFELMWPEFLDAAAARLGTALPAGIPDEIAVLVEIEDHPADLADMLMPLVEDGTIADAIIAQSERERERLWAWRDSIGPLVEDMAIVEPFDVSIPAAAIGDVVDVMRHALITEIPGCRPLFFGHIGDGNLHLAVELPHESARSAAERIIYGIVRDAHGSISAEHGIGLLKGQWLGYTRSVAEVTVMRRIRDTLDPSRILNRNRIFP